MAHKPIQPKQRRREGTATGEELEHLIHGYCMLDGDEPFQTEEERRECWEANRGFVMGLQGKQCQDESFLLSSRGVYFDLFQRPDAWWSYDAPEPRRRLTGDPGAVVPGCEYRKGKPTVFHVPDWDQIPEYETQKAYLMRLGLLNKAEKGF